MITKKDIGRRVVVNGECDSRMFDNEKGKIIGILSHGFPNIGVRFDKKHPWMHNCDGLENEGCENGHGWFVDEKNITLEGGKMTGIRIETEKIVESNGNLCRKITGFKAIHKHDLPDMYIKGKRPVCYVNNGRLYTENRAEGFNDGFFRIDEIISEDKLQKLLDHCKQAGDHLMDVNRELKEKREKWNGTETFIF